MDAMDRRVFIKGVGAAFITLMLSGCDRLSQKNYASLLPAQSIDKTVQGGNKMRITVIAGSPHKNGTSALLADKFIEGAQKAGHDVLRFNAAFEDTHPCRGCDSCGMDGPCVHNDAIEQKLMPRLLQADLIVFVTPLYYYGMSAQLKTVVDRFYSRAGKVAGHGRKSILMATAYNSADWTMTALMEHYKTLVKYLEWQDVGTVLALGCGSRSLIERSKYPEQSYQMGLNL